VWWVGAGTARHFDGKTWSAVAFAQQPYGTAVDLWGSAANDVWATDGLWVRHWDGASWSPIDLPPHDMVMGLRARATDDIWLAERGGTHHWDGHAITCSANWYQELDAMGGTPDDLWVAGTIGTVLRRHR
jgi:hypothetical protein